jgi:hypothetical protein
MVCSSNCWKHVEFDIGLCQYGAMHAAKQSLAHVWKPLSFMMHRIAKGWMDIFERAPQLRSFDSHVDAMKVRLPWTRLSDLSMSAPPLGHSGDLDYALTMSFNL